jgi:hypothetical protein
MSADPQRKRASYEDVLSAPADWVCEIFSPGTQRIARMRKMPIYGREKVGSSIRVRPRSRCSATTGRAR